MDYRETGLPMDQTVYKAFMMFTKNAKDAAKGMANIPGMDDPANFPVRVAQVLHQSGANDPKLLSLALLNVLPPQTYSAIEKSFGQEMTGLMEEAGKHNKTGFAYITEASDNVKLLTLASAIATFDEFGQVSQIAEQQLDKLASGEEPPGGSLMLPMMPDSMVYERLSAALMDKTSSPALESLFQQKLSDFRWANQQLQDKISGMGIADQLPPGMGMGPGQGGMPDMSDLRYPSFEETTLLDDPKVRAAYEVLTTHTRVAPETFEAALEVGKILSNDVASKNPTAIAAGLLTIGIRGLNASDFEFLDKKLDWDVTELLKNNTPSKVRSPAQLMRAPEEFKQIMMANMISSLGHLKDGVGMMKDMIDMREEIPAEVRPMIIAENLDNMLFMTEMMEDTARIIGDAGAPELGKAFREKLTEARQIISDNMPKIPRAQPGLGMPFPPKPPKPPKPGKGGQEFDL